MPVVPRSVDMGMSMRMVMRSVLVQMCVATMPSRIV